MDLASSAIFIYSYKMLHLRRNKRYKYFLYKYCIMIFFFLFSDVAEGAVCQKYDYVQNDAAVLSIESSVFTSESPVVVTPHSDHPVKVNYTCPGSSDPRHHTECCSSVHSKGCCPRIRYFYEIDRTIATIIAVSVVTFCITLTIVITICCFWSRCPLYLSCRQEYNAEIASYVSKESVDMDTMPREISKKNNKFSPIAISNGNIPSGVDMEAI